LLHSVDDQLPFVVDVVGKRRQVDFAQTRKRIRVPPIDNQVVVQQVAQA
jgi:hypothetical protein